MKIALIAPSAIPSLSANSMQVMKMADALAGLGNEVGVFALPSGAHAAWAELKAHYGLKHPFVMNYVVANPFLRRYDFAFSALRSAREFGADLVYTRVPQAAALAARSLPTIFELHDVPSGWMGPRLLRAFLRGRGAQRVVVNTRVLAERVLAMYPSVEDKLTLAPNGVDLQPYVALPKPAAARKQLGLSEGFTVGYTGHLYKGRGISFMLELARRNPSMQFLFVGGKPEDVAERKVQAGVLNNVRFVGFVPNSELPLYQAASDVLVLPYGKQVTASSGGDIAAYTNPLKMFEYLASGRAILASKLPVLNEVLDGRNALILPAKDVEVWAATLTRLENHPAEREALGKAARETAQKFSWEQRARRVLEG